MQQRSLEARFGYDIMFEAVFGDSRRSSDAHHSLITNTCIDDAVLMEWKKIECTGQVPTPRTWATANILGTPAESLLAVALTNS